MKNIISAISVLLVGFVAAGCDQKRDAEWYLNHKVDLISQYSECVNKNEFNELCTQIDKAIEKGKNDPEIKAGVGKVRAELFKKNLQKGARHE